MINKLALFFEGFAKSLGLGISIPRPGKKMLNISFWINILFGISLVLSGILFSKKFLGLIGSVGFLSAIFLMMEKEGLEN